MKKYIAPNDAYRIRKALGKRNIVFTGMMGCGKSAIGKRLAANIDIPFHDADQAIEQAANMTIPDIFETFGEKHFRDGERRVIQRLMGEGPAILSTGGGAFMNDETRSLIKQDGISIWLRADFDVLMERVQRKNNRPLLKTANPEETMRNLLKEREPFYELADITVESRDESHEAVVMTVVDGLLEYLEGPN